MISSKFTLVGLLLIFITGALGHSYLTNPQSRSNQKQSETGCRGPACLGPCDKPLAQATTPAVTIQRGATINPQWPRNNHAGGFIRFAWAKTSDSDNAAAFDAGVEEIVCHEIGGCKPDDPANPNGGDSAPADGSFQPCQTTIKVPLYLTDGTWTLQWAWFGGAFALGDYYSCVDYVISGGPSGPQLSAVYNGGDYTYPGQNKCKFFNTDRLHQCVNEPCSNPVYPLSQEESGPAYGVSSSNSVPLTSTTAAQAPATTAKAIPSTTAKQVVIPSTTGKQVVVPSTTGKAVVTTASTTASAPQPIVSVTTGMAAVPSSNPGSNCAGLTTLSSSLVTIASVDSWSSEFHMIVLLHVQETVLRDWMIEIVWPSNAVNTQVITTYNGGSVQCQATTPENHVMIMPVANWANNLPQGYVLTVEIMATNTNMNNDFIKANTQFNVYKR